MYEHRRQPLLPLRAYLVRLLRHAVAAAAIIGGSLGIGMVGYHALAGLAWIDAFANAAMILSGMGPLDPLPSPAAKLFAGGYALFSGIVFIGAAGVLIAPVAHRVLHGLHLADRD